MDRRKFIVSTGALASLGVLPRVAAASGAPASRTVRLVAQATTIDVGGKSARVLELRGSEGNGIALKGGTPYTVLVENRLPEPTVIHWHGLAVPNDVDGVGGITQPMIAAGATQAYRFTPQPNGTHWMHAHVPFQEVGMLAAPLIVHDPADAGRDEREIVVFLEDYTSRNPAAIWRGLIAPNAMADMPGMTDPARQDLNDVDYDAYLANRRTFDDPQIVRVERGGMVRLRVINASSATNYTLDLGALSATVIAVDGRPVAPFSASRIPLAIAQRVDLRFPIPSTGVFPVTALREGAFERSGIVLATPGAWVPKTSGRASAKGPIVGYDFERSLHAAHPLAARAAGVRVDLRLTGLMGRYVWGIDGQSFPMDSSKIPPALVNVRRGDRVVLTFTNQTSMSHPMHLHGHAFQVTALNGEPVAGAMRDTVMVPTLRSVRIAFDANNPGTWMLHCHNAWHLQAGMATTVKYAG